MMLRNLAVNFQTVCSCVSGDWWIENSPLESQNRSVMTKGNFERKFPSIVKDIDGRVAYITGKSARNLYHPP